MTTLPLKRAIESKQSTHSPASGSVYHSEPQANIPGDRNGMGGSYFDFTSFVRADLFNNQAEQACRMIT